MITGITSTVAQTRTIRFQANGAFPRVSTVFQMGRATNANEKTIAAHLRKNSSPTPINVAAKKKTKIEIMNCNGKGPRRDRWPMRTKRRPASKTKVITPNALIAVALIRILTRH